MVINCFYSIFPLSDIASISICQMLRPDPLFFIDLAAREKYIYVLVSSKNGRIFTDFITATPS